MMQLQGKLPQPIENLTLNKYFELVKEIELAFCDENGFQNVLDMKTDWLISKTWRRKKLHEGQWMEGKCFILTTDIRKVFWPTETTIVQKNSSGGCLAMSIWGIPGKRL